VPRVNSSPRIRPIAAAIAATSACVFSPHALWDGEARADVAIEWQGSAAGTIGVTSNVANTPVPLTKNATEPEWDGYASVTPGIQFSFETPRTRQTLGAAVDYRLYFVHTEASAFSSSLGYSFNGDVSPEASLTFGLNFSETQASEFNLVGSATTTPALLTTSSDAYLLTGTASQALSVQIGPGTFFSQGLSFVAAENLPLVDGVIDSTTESQTYIGSGTLALHHELKNDVVGGDIGSDIGAFPPSISGTTSLDAHTDIVHRAELDWRHQYSLDWSTTLTGGVVVAYETSNISPVVNPTGTATLDFANGKGSAALSYSHGVQPNLVLHQMTLADTATLRGALPIASTGLDLSGSAAFLTSRTLESAGLGAPTYGIIVDAAVGYVRPRLPLRFELRYQMNRQFGLGDEADTTPDIRRTNVQFTVTWFFPHMPQGGLVPSLVPLPTPTSDPALLGKTPETRGQIEDGDHQKAQEQKEKGKDGGKDSGGKDSGGSP
jgi:hypothetical protein